jgi:hypothetical protein
MKLKPEPREIDLYVKQVKLTDKEKKEFGKFMEEVRRRDKAKKAKHRKAAA